jgi:hypothetical protein
MSERGAVSVTLVLDGVYYTQAFALAEAAKAADAVFSKWQEFVRDTNERIDSLSGDASREDEVHDLCVELDRHWQSFDGAAGKLVQLTAATHILCGSALEAHINMRAEEKLSTKEFNEFDKLTLAGKWLFYPTLISAGRFDPGRAPFQ